ncbi:MAG TPA: hypothetical protein PKD54_09445 [Pirellulaceae bacterium]|nr:hypothetical protein [Pirellulaceae bacterium]
MNASPFEWTTALIRRRKTTKILADVGAPVSIPDDIARNCDALVREAVVSAGWAPFHFARQANGLAEPWRATILWQATCRQLAAAFPQLFTDVKPGNKLPGMLSACGALVLITEVPNTGAEIPDPQKLQQVNFEHTLAVGAMIQSLLLALEAAELPTYWSSGGQLGSITSFELLGIPLQERLAGAVFVGYPVERYAECEQIPGGNREKRSLPTQWIREFAAIPE